MYKAAVQYKGYTTTNVHVQAPEDANTEDVLSSALAAAGETKANIFGWDAQFWPGSGDWTVSLYTD